MFQPPWCGKGWHTNEKNVYINVHKQYTNNWHSLVKIELGGVWMSPDPHWPTFSFLAVTLAVIVHKQKKCICKHTQTIHKRMTGVSFWSILGGDLATWNFSIQEWVQRTILVGIWKILFEHRGKSCRVYFPGEVSYK